MAKRQIEFHWDCNVAGGDGSEIEWLEDDYTDDELNDLAENYMYDNLSPEFWWEDITDIPEDDDYED